MLAAAQFGKSREDITMDLAMYSAAGLFILAAIVTAYMSSRSIALKRGPELLKEQEKIDEVLTEIRSKSNNNFTFCSRKSHCN